MFYRVGEYLCEPTVLLYFSGLFPIIVLPVFTPGFIAPFVGVYVWGLAVLMCHVTKVEVRGQLSEVRFSFSAL